MSAKMKVGMPMLLKLAAAILGAVVGFIVTSKLVSAAPQTVFEIQGKGLQVGGLIGLVIGVGLAIFGNRIHPLLRWFGVGWTAATFGEGLRALVPAT